MPTRVPPFTKSLLCLYPSLSKEWADEDRSASDVSVGSEYKALWRCSADPEHLWRANVYNRARQGKGCPYCSGRSAIKGKNDLLTTHPEYENFWDDSRDITGFSAGSNRKVWWKCSDGHRWEALVYDVVSRGRGCPYCSGRRVVAGFNDLTTTHPHLVDEWADESKHPSEVSRGSDYSAGWRCSLGHYWEASISSRAAGYGCPYCSGNSVWKGFNDVASTHPDLVAEWDDDAVMTEFSYGSNYKADWKCFKGHQWSASISVRAKGHGCPECVAPVYVSAPEKEIVEYLSSFGYDIRTSVRTLIPPFEVDIYIPEKNVAIEYNGLYWHSEDTGKTEFYHYRKWSMCRDKGVDLFTVWEDDFLDNPDRVKRILARHIGLVKPLVISAGNASVRTVTPDVADDFYAEYSMSGFSPGRAVGGDCSSFSGLVHYGLFGTIDSGSSGDSGSGVDHETNDDSSVAEMLSLISWRKSDADTVLIEHHASSESIDSASGFKVMVGGVVEHCQSIGAKQILVIDNNEFSCRRVYEQSGFVFMSAYPPDYDYLVQGRRVCPDPDDSLEGIGNRIWDSGYSEFRLLIE